MRRRDFIRYLCATGGCMAVRCYCGHQHSCSRLRQKTTTTFRRFTTGGIRWKWALSQHRPARRVNVTGATQTTMEVGEKRLDSLHQLMPKATVLAIAVNPPTLLSPRSQTATHEAARALGLEVEIVQAVTRKNSTRPSPACRNGPAA